ncbi:MAG: bifunctional (p)ppGpp synthetase/guanosine-3',5'-bis(diphosphate) 3'-pyrophosphohydrolase [Acholeplasmatales bacterium]|nr:bifunctional (p)ppGpp synthetase/guanosine-3',5'-bis(diphosphate) 3'-pyrophosphohydrolase [Acholeplasmatales bacterium]MDY4017063.1 bifunctional (p)ppGpp synthetase/guanosine-3',5'-bis(diphosphate) 3'-pyrophosphohydrolase [Bacilli bacterium]
MPDNNSCKTIDDIITYCQSYLHNEDNLNLIKKAYDVAKKKHEGQFRKSGDPYIQHPVEVAYILATLHAGPDTIAAGLLHDVLEDTDMSKEEMAATFNKDVAEIVDGVTKISKLKYMTKEKALAHNHEKLLLAMAKDIRVILVKIADRLHNMRTIQFHSEEKQKRIAQETLDLYAPLAHRLGMYRIKAELEDLSFKALEPEKYAEIAKEISFKKTERDEDVEKMISTVKGLLEKNHINHYDIKGRVKNIYSIYKKIITKNKTIDDIYDLLALRVIVDSVEQCYHVLGIIHSIWTPLPMRFKDYIAVPKPNMYQSLHTTVVGPAGKIYEIQIRTYEMDQIAEFGVAAHWAYKENVEYSHEKEQLEIVNKLKWYKDLTTYVENSATEDPLDSIIEDIFSANVYIFTPKGDVYDFPAGSMPLDFAYRIHSDIGNKTVGAIVNGKIVPLSYKLKTGDVVEIKTNKACTGPTTEWLKLAKTSHAKTKIKAFINKKQRDAFVAKGLEELTVIGKNYNYAPTTLDDKQVMDLFGKNGIRTVEDLYWTIGKGEISALAAINRILGLTDVKLDDEFALKQYSEDSSKNRKRVATNGFGIIVEGLERAKLHLGNCCQPVYGDEISGYISKGNGIIIHRVTCPNVEKASPERFINVYWDKDFSGRIFDTTLKIIALDRRNLVADMINILNGCNVTIASVTSTKNRTGDCMAKFKLQVSGLNDLNNAILNLKKIPEIYQIERVNK